MCGIVGALVFKEQQFTVTEPYLSAMRDAMAHRGPDGAGAWISLDGRVGLGHRRLSIIDLTTIANQPMCNEDGTVWVVFNGEIYNHAQVRRELEALGGHQWKTDHSDTEVIIHAYEQWGIECLHRFRGMFAIAIWDARVKELWLIRDRVGVKPLYYSFHHNRLTFASEIKALLEDPQQQRAVDEDALFAYLSFLTTPAPQTLFAGIQKLPPGTWMRVRANGQVEQHRYWDAWDWVKPQLSLSDAELAERVLAELRVAVELRGVSDVPVGIFLSGGIDSSTNAVLFADRQQGAVRTFSIGYDDEYGTYPNELHHARRVAESIGATHHERRLSVDDLLSFLPRMIALQDEPIADPVCVPVYYVSKLARDHGVIVCQVGEGADELFCGYPSWQTALRLQGLQNLPIPRSLQQLGLWGLRRLGRESTLKYEWLRRGASGLPIFWGGAEAFTDGHKFSLLSPRLKAKFAGRSAWEVIEPIYHRFRAKAWETSPLHWMTYLDLNYRLPELLLMRVDKMSMGVALEARVPFLDHRFVELALGIPTAAKLRGGIPKSLLKKAVRGVIPDDIIDRRKQGFGVPIHEWFLGRLGQQARAELDDFCRQTDYLDRDGVERLFAQRRGGQIWYLLNFALWWKHYIAGATSAVSRFAA